MWRWAALTLLVASCDGARESRILLHVSTDLNELERLRVTAIHPRGRVSAAEAELDHERRSRTLELVHRDGPLGPVRLVVEGLVGERTLVSVEREVHFTEGRTLELVVHLAAACRELACDGGRTCGNDGECRWPTVEPCEHQGGCGGAEDAGVDAPALPVCLGVEVCGVQAHHLPGDRVAPRPCADVPVVTSVRDPSGAALDTTHDAVLLSSSGTHLVEMALAADPACVTSLPFRVVAPSVIPDAAGVSSDTLRDLAARVGTAFIAGRRGAYAIDEHGWAALRPVVVGELPEDLRAVAVHGGQPVFGPNGDRDAVFRVEADAPYRVATSAHVPLPSASREVRALAVRLDGQGPLLAATKDGAVLVDELGARQLGPSYDPSTTGWAALGAEEAEGRGAVWLGRGDEIANRSLTGAVAFNDASPAPFPTWIVPVRAVEVDDRDPSRARLWICGAGGVAIVALDAFSASDDDLPIPAFTWGGTCHDLAVGDDGHGWVAAGDALVRLDDEARPSVVYGVDRGLPASARVDAVAFAWDGARREVWALDMTARAVLWLSADARP